MAEDVGWTATNRLREDLARHCLDLDLAFHNAHTPGELIQRLDHDVRALANFFSASRCGCWRASSSGSSACWSGSIGGSAWRSPASSPGLAALTRVRAWPSPTRGPAWRRRGAQFGFLEERLAGTEDMRARGATAYVLRGLYPHDAGSSRARRTAGATFAALLGTTSLVAATGTALAYAMGGSLFQAGAITIGTVYAIVAYTTP